MTEDAPITEIEKTDESIVSSNLQKMETDMMKLIMSESIGGNAGHVEKNGKRIPCAGANGFANGETGEIVVFDNIQNVPSDVVENNLNFIFRVALDYKGGSTEVVETGLSSRFSDVAKENIEEAASRYNEKYGHQKIPTRSG